MRFREDKNARIGVREKKQRETKTKWGKYITYTLCTMTTTSRAAKASISQRHFSMDVLKRTCYEKKKDIVE